MSRHPPFAWPRLDEGLTSMKRTLVFLLLEPIFGARLHLVAAGGKLSGVFGEAGLSAFLADGVRAQRGTRGRRVLVAVAQLSKRPPFAVMNHLAPPLKASFTLQQPKGAGVISP
jgi:hypothetical protein